jgi:diacylglycerol kinase (ATP)
MGQRVGNRGASTISLGRVQIVYNPLAGSFNAPRLAALERAFTKAGHSPLMTECSSQTAFALGDSTNHLCVAGGDGTIRQVVSALAGHASQPPMSIYPMGTINLIAREWRVPRTPKAFVASFETARQLHPVKLNEGWFVACASVGPDSRAVAGVSEDLKRRIGRFAYAASLAQQFVKWQRPKLSVEIDGNAMDCEALYIANGRYFAGPWSFAPTARVDQPVLHVVALTKARRRDFAQFMIATMLGKAHRLKNARHLTCTSLSVSGDGPHLMQGDGDIVATLPIEMQITSQHAA